MNIYGYVSSPSFVLVREHKGRLNLYHIDLYRVQSLEDVKGLGIEEIVNDPQNIVAIEWAERMGELLPKRRIDVRFDYLGEEKRKITISC